LITRRDAQSNESSINLKGKRDESEIHPRPSEHKLILSFLVLTFVLTASASAATQVDHERPTRLFVGHLADRKKPCGA